MYLVQTLWMLHRMGEGGSSADPGIPHLHCCHPAGQGLPTAPHKYMYRLVKVQASVWIAAAGIYTVSKSALAPKLVHQHCSI